MSPVVRTRVMVQALFFMAFLFASFFPYLIPGGSAFFRFNISSVSLAALSALTLFGALATVLLLVLVTLFFGRVFCGWACPLGAMADALDYLFRFPAKGEQYKSIKYHILLICVVTSLAGTSIVWLFDPLSWAEQIIDVLTVRSGNIIWSLSLLAVFLGLHWAFGRRAFCRIVCPLGAALGVIAARSFFKRELDEEKCTDCNLCVTNNRSFAIGHDPRIYNSGECFQCRECEGICPTKALSFRYVGRYKGKPDGRINVQQIP